MDIRKTLEILNTISEATKETGKGRIHTSEPGGYGRKDDEDAPKKETTRGRGRPKKDADDAGEVKKYDTKSLHSVFGGGEKPKKEVGKTSKKHSLKDWMEHVEANPTLSEGTKEIKGGRRHTAEPGGYGRKDDEDEKGKKVASTVKRGRGRPKKDADADGEVKKYDWSAFGATGKDIKLPKHTGTVTKHKMVGEAEQVTIQPAQQNTQVIKQGNDVLGSVSNPQLAAQIKNAIGKGEMTLAGDDLVNEDSDDLNPVESAIALRITSRHPELIKHGLDNVLDAIREVASNVGDVEEIGTSDVSGWVKQVKDRLSNSQQVSETKVSKYKDLGANQNTTHFIKNMTTGKIVSPHRSRQDAEDALVASTRNSKDEFKIVRAKKSGLTEGDHKSVSFRDMVNVVDRYDSKYYAALSASDISDEEFEKAIVDTYNEIVRTKGLDTVLKYISSGYPDLNEGDDRGNYRATAQAAEAATRAAKTPQEHARAADLHDRAATYALSDGRDESVIYDHQMTAREHRRAAKGVSEGLGKSIKRGMAGWGAFDKDKPADVVNRVKGQDTDTLKTLSNRGSTGKGSPAELQQKAISRELKKRGEQGVAEGQLNEYLTQEGSPFSDILGLNLFMDMGPGPDGVGFMAHSLVKKYKPVASQLARLIRAQKKRKLTSDESDMIDKVWYDGSDAYDDMEVEFLADLYNQQIEVVKDILENQQGVSEGQLDEISAKLAQAVADKRGSNAATYRAGLAATGVDQDAITKYPPWRKMSYKALKSQQAATQRLNKERGVSEVMAAPVDEQTTLQYARRISDAIEQTTGATVQVNRQKDGSQQIVINPRSANPNIGYMVPNGNVGATIQNVDNAIDDFYRMFRQKGWRFDQPVHGQFTIAVPQQGVNEGATPASPSKIFRLIKRQHNDWFDIYGMGEVEDTVTDMHEMGQFDGMSAEDAVVLVGQELESLYGPEGMSESSTGDYSAKKARAGKDIGKPGKNFEKIAKSAGERYGSAEKGKKVAGAVLAKLRTNEGDDNDTPIVEKAVSKNQQKFMGMVHAAQKGEKPASKEVAKVAKTMKKSDVKDFAQTKHKGLPKKVSESINLYEGPSNIEHIVNRFKYEVKQFLNGDELDSDLYNALFDYYADAGEIPYGIAKARTGDPMEWVSARFRTDVKPYVNQTSMATRNISDGMEEGMEIGTTRNTPFSTRPELSQVPAAQRKASGQNFPLTMKQVGDTSNKLSSLDTIRAMKDSSPFKFEGKTNMTNSHDIRRIMETIAMSPNNIVNEGIVDKISRFAVPKLMKLLGPDAAKVANAVKQATGGDLTPSKENAIKVVKALSLDKAVSGGQRTSEGIAGNWQGKLIQALYTLGVLGAGGAAYSMWGTVEGTWVAAVGVLLLTFANTFFGTAPGQIGAMGNFGNKGTDMNAGLDVHGMPIKDRQVESWEKQLNSLLTEGITVTSSTGQQGMPDSVSINATDSDAQELLAIVRQAGLGVFGGGEQQSSDYGAPMSDTEPQGFGSEPEVSPTVVGDGDDMLALIKKMTGIEMDDGQEEVLHGTGADYEDEGDTSSDDEEETTEGNAFTGALAKAKQDGVQPGEKMKVGGKEYPVKEDDVEEGNKFTGNLAKARAEGKKEADLDGDGDMEKVHEGEHTCNECGLMEAECECDHEEEKVDEAFANDAGGDAMEDTELAKLKALLSMGNDLHKMKRDQTVLNPTQVSVQEALSDWKKLSGIK